MRLRAAAATLAQGVLVLAAPTQGEPRFDVIEPPPGSSYTEARAVSADGCSLVGVSAPYAAFRWRDGVSLPLLDEFEAYPETNPWSANALTPDGRIVGGMSHAEAYVLYPLGSGWDLQRIDRIDGLWPNETYALTPDGRIAVGIASDGAGHGYAPFYWRQFGISQILGGGGGEARALSSDGLVVGGTAANQAMLWRPVSSPSPQPLGFLPGDDRSEVRDISADGTVAVGRSWLNWQSSSRAFRWTSSGMLDLGPMQIATAVTANGSVVVGSDFDRQRAFVWVAGHGVRELADLLRDDYGLDTGDYRLMTIDAVSDDGKTFAGRGLDPEFSSISWRIRLREDRCPAPSTALDLVANYAAGPAFDGVSSLAVDSQGRAYLGATDTQNVVRIDPANPDAPPQELLDLGADEYGVPTLLGVGPDDSVYVGSHFQRKLWRIAPDGAVELVLDTSAWPPHGPAANPLPTAPRALAIAADGTLYLAADARVLRIDPDGSVHQLIDSLTATAIAVPGSSYADSLSQIALGEDGRLLVILSGGALLVLDAQSGALRAAPQPTWGWDFIQDPAGGLWAYGNRLTHIDVDGRVRPVYGPGRVPDGRGGFLARISLLTGDAEGNVYYAANAGFLMRTAAGQLQPVLPIETPVLPGGQLVGSLWEPKVLFAADGVFYAGFDDPDREYSVCPPDYTPCWVNTESPPNLVRYGLPVSTACQNGLDDDGDGLTDFPADAGCLSLEDEGERSFERPCDNGLDDDHDGAADYPADPGCGGLRAPFEATECDDGLDNDGDGKIDWDGAFDEPSAEMLPPDPECQGNPRNVIEHPMYCGLGFEVAVVVLPIVAALRRVRARRIKAA